MCVFVAYHFGFTSEFALKVTRYYNYNIKFKSWIKLLDPARPRELDREEENSQKRKNLLQESSASNRNGCRYGYERKGVQLTTQIILKIQIFRMEREDYMV